MHNMDHSKEIKLLPCKSPTPLTLLGNSNINCVLVEFIKNRKAPCQLGREENRH